MSEHESSAHHGRPNEPNSYAELVSACKGARPWTVESLCRCYVSANRDNLPAWFLLLDIVEQNGNSPEAIRLTRAAMEQFPHEERLPVRLARQLLNDLRVREAGPLLEERARSKRMTSEEAQLFGDLLLARDPPQALRWFEKILEKKPDDRSAQLGLQNARQLGDPARRRPLIGFYLLQDWHYPIQLSTYEAASAAGIPSLITSQPWLLRMLKPKVLVLSDTPFGPMQRVRMTTPRPFIVNTRHGISDKNYTWYSAGAADRVCATSQRVADELVKRGLFAADHFWVTGYPQMDALFRASRQEAIARNVLFAPTWTPHLSAGDLLGENVVQAIRGDDASIRVTIKPHPLMRSSAPALLASWRTSAKQLPNVHFVDDVTSDLNALMADAEIMVSDVSSVAVQYLALDRPIVCVVNPSVASRSRSYAPDGIEWQLHSGAMVASNAVQTAKAVRDALIGRTPPGVVKERRALREHVYGNLTDGRAGERIVSFIRQEIESQPTQR